MYSELNGDKFETYTTVDGDTWFKIAAKAYGDGSKFDPIVQCNFGVPILPVLKAGIKLKIPVIAIKDDENDVSLLPPWKQVPKESTQQAVASIPAFLNPGAGGDSTPGSFDDSFD